MTRVAPGETLLAQPLQQAIGIGCIENLIEPVVRLAPLAALGQGQQVKVVIAEHTDRAVAEGGDKTQRLQRIRPARNQIAGEQQAIVRSEEHTSELQSLMRTAYAVFCLKKKTNNKRTDVL